VSPTHPPQPPHPDSRFDADWLALREGADAAARARELTDLTATWLSGRANAPYLCVDLGTGSGSNPRFLAPRLPGPQSWRLLDHDAALLERAARDCGDLRDAAGSVVDLWLGVRDLSALAPEDLGCADLVCASALIDLVDASFLDRLAEACASAGAAVLISLSVDGEWRCERAGSEDVDPDDALVRAAFNAHQRRDKGVGTALGPDAPVYLAGRLRRLGYQVRVARSPWRLGMERPRDAALAAALIDGWLVAALEQEPVAAVRLRTWHARRKAALDDPAFVLTVGHVDLFACPGGGDPVSGDEG
jgi:hypothetical protein